MRRRRRDDRGETLALLVVWPALIAAILLMLTAPAGTPRLLSRLRLGLPGAARPLG